jgi:GTP cyclohydrolase I
MDNKYQVTKEEVADRLKQHVMPGLAVWGVPRGGTEAAKLLEDQNLIVATPETADVIVDDLVDSGATKRRYEKEYPSKRFVVAYDKQKEPDFRGKWIVFPWEKPDDGELHTHVARLLQGIGQDTNREGLLKTPERVVKALREMTAGYGMDPAVALGTVFRDEQCDQMVVCDNIEFSSLCEHHLMPFFGVAHIGYIPHDNLVVGLSKLGRVVDVYARRLQVQERMGREVAAAIEKHVSPHVAVLLEAKHACMMCRGVRKQSSVMRTSSLLGNFRKQEVRMEFFEMIRR